MRLSQESYQNSTTSRRSSVTTQSQSTTSTTTGLDQSRRSTATNKKEAITNTNTQSLSESSSTTDNNNTIALFGSGSPTATHFLRLALDAGYRVRALLVQSDHALASRSTYQGQASRTAKKLRDEFADCGDPALEWIRAGSVYDQQAVATVLQNAQYVVCMMNEAPLVCEGQDEGRQPTKYNAQKKKKLPLPEQPLTSFLRDVLYPLMRREDSMQVFLYQVSTKFNKFTTTFFFVVKCS